LSWLFGAKIRWTREYQKMQFAGGLRMEDYMFEEKYSLNKGTFTSIFLSLWVVIVIYYSIKTKYFYNTLKDNIIEALIFLVVTSVFLFRSIWTLLGEVIYKINDKEFCVTKILLGLKMSNKYKIQDINEICIEVRKSNRYWGGGGFRIYEKDEELVIIRSQGKEIEIGRGLADFQAKKIYNLLNDIKRGTKQ
jgi:hypothetical protein